MLDFDFSSSIKDVDYLVISFTQYYYDSIITGEFSPACWSSWFVCVCICVSVCLWTSLRRSHTVSSQHINIISTSQHSLTLNYRLTFFQRSRSKVKVTGVKSSIFGLHAITQKVFVRFSQFLQDRSSKVWDRSLFQDDLERSKVKVTAGVKVRKFKKNNLISHFLI